MTEFKVTRRMLGGAAAGGVFAAATIGAVPAQSARKTFVLLSGSFCGGWIWRRVTDRLEQGGHKVFAPSLTGLGDRSHLLSKDVNLETHISDVVNLVRWEGLENVCLVAWSYAGFVGAGALENIGSQVSSIVWLDALLPTDGQKVADYLAGSPFAKVIQTAVDKGEASFRPPKQFGVAAVAEQDQAFAQSKVTAHPVGTYIQAIKLSGALEKVAKKTYIRLPKFPQPGFDTALAACKGNNSWATFELPDIGHMSMLDAPDRTSELILQGA
jgi:pimeloyl-ACP methyl ester carboxylesterase